MSLNTGNIYAKHQSEKVQTKKNLNGSRFKIFFFSIILGECVCVLLTYLTYLKKHMKSVNDIIHRRDQWGYITSIWSFESSLLDIAF